MTPGSKDSLHLMASLADVIDKVINKEPPECGFILIVFDTEKRSSPMYVSSVQSADDVQAVLMAQLRANEGPGQTIGTIDKKTGEFEIDADAVSAEKPTPH